MKYRIIPINLNKAMIDPQRGVEIVIYDQRLWGEKFFKKETKGRYILKKREI